MLSEVSPRVGTTTLPLLPGPGCTNGWLCSSWCSSTHQLRLVAPSVPSSGSVALPAKVRVSPALKSAPSAGDVITGAGGALGPPAGVLAPLSEPPPHDASAMKATTSSVAVRSPENRGSMSFPLWSRRRAGRSSVPAQQAGGCVTRRLQNDSPTSRWPASVEVVDEECGWQKKIRRSVSIGLRLSHRRGLRKRRPHLFHGEHVKMRCLAGQRCLFSGHGLRHVKLGARFKAKPLPAKVVARRPEDRCGAMVAKVCRCRICARSYGACTGAVKTSPAPHRKDRVETRRSRSSRR